MRRLGSVLVVGAMLALAGYAVAGKEGKECPSKAAATAAKAGCGAKTASACGTSKLLANCPTCKKADELVQAWSNAPAKLAAMTEDGKQAGCPKTKAKAASHPGMDLMPATMAYLNESLTTLAALDAACQQLCAKGCAKEEGASQCPKTAEAKQRMAMSMGLIAKANELHLAARTAMGGGCAGEAGKSACGSTTSAKLASAEGEAKGTAGGCCAKKSEAAGAKLTSAEGKPEKADGGCDKKSAEAKLASAEAKSEKAGGCCAKKSKAAEAKLTAAEDRPEKSDGGCGSKKEARTVASVADAGAQKPCTKSEVRATVASAEGKPCDSPCVKATVAADTGEICAETTMAKAEGLVKRSGKLLARWEGADVRLASMTDGERRELKEACAAVRSSCPIGSLMPGTISTMTELLSKAATLQTQCEVLCAENPSMTKDLPAEVKEIARTRAMLTCATLNVLKKLDMMVEPTKQVAMATN